MTNRRLAVHAVLKPQQPPIEPAMAKRVHVDGSRLAELGDAREALALSAVRPGADDQPLQALLGLRQLHVVEVGHLGAPRVVPASDVIGRHILILGNVIDDAGAHVGPVGIIVAVTHRLNEPCLVLGRELERCRPWAERQRPRVLLHARAHAPAAPQRRPAMAAARAAASAPLGVGASPVADARMPVALPRREDPVQPPQLERAVMADAELSGVAHSVHGHHGRKGRRIGDADGMLRGAGVRRAYRTDLAVGPRLLGNPLQQVRAVWSIVANRTPRAFGAVSASNILEHDDIATRDEIFHDIRLPWSPCCRPSARQSSENDRSPSRLAPVHKRPSPGEHRREQRP